MSEEEETNILVLCGSDDVRVEVSAKVIAPSMLLRDVDFDENDRIDFPVPRVEGSILQIIVDYLNYYATNPMNKIVHPIEGETLEEVVTQEWYAKFINDLDERTVYKLLLAANFMDIQPLLDLIVLRVAWLFSKKSPEELKNLLNFPELTPEQEERARRDHPWIFEN